MAKKQKKPKKQDPFKRFNMKFSKKDFKFAQAKADQHTGGNVSEYIKAAMLRYIPKKNEKFRKMAVYRKRT